MIGIYHLCSPYKQIKRTEKGRPISPNDPETIVYQEHNMPDDRPFRINELQLADCVVAECFSLGQAIFDSKGTIEITSRGSKMAVNVCELYSTT